MAILGRSQSVHRVFFGHHKHASRFFRFSVFVPIAVRKGWDVVTYEIDNPPYHFSDLPDLDLDNINFDRLRNPEPAVVNLLNSSPAVVSKMDEAAKDFRGLHVFRDPRQVLVSAYFHHRNGHPIESQGLVWDQLDQDRPVLQSLPVEDGLLYELDHITGSVLEDQVAAWTPDSRILDVRVEEVNQHPWSFLWALRKHLDLGWHFPRVKWERKYSDSGASHWSRHFTPRVKDVFKQRYGELLIRLGYTDGMDW